MASNSGPISGQNGERPYEADLSLVKSITSGSVNAWHEFLDRYSGLIYSVVRRHLFTEDEDEIRSVYVDILKALYEGELSNYEGKAQLSTWLIVTTRSRTIDSFRKRHGRQRTPEGYDSLSEFDKRVLQLYYVDRLPLDVAVYTLEWSGFPVNVNAFVESVQRIENTLDQRYLNKLEAEHQAQKSGADSVPMLKYLFQLKLEFDERSAADRADQSLLERATHEAIEQLRALVSSLSPEEKRILFLRFERGMSAGKIAEKLELGSSRRAYSLINKIVRKLRKAMLGEGD